MNTGPVRTKEEKAWQKPGNSIYLGLLPVLLSLVLVIGLWRFPPGFGVYEPPFLLPIFNTILFLAAAVIAYIAWRSYLLSGVATILWIGCGVLALGTGALAAGWLIYPFGPNANVTIFNVAVLLAAICFTGGVTVSLDGEARIIEPERRPRRVTMAYLAILAALAMLVGLTLGGVMPPFFIQGQGPTVLRQYVVEWSLVLLIFASLVIMSRFGRLRSAFLYWYSLALALVAIAMLAFFLQAEVGSLIGWVGRTSYVLAAIYFLVSVSSARRQARSLGVGLSEAMAELFGPEQHRALFDSLNESLAIDELLFDEQGKPYDWRILNVNSAYLKTSGKSQDEVIGRRLTEIYGIDRAPEPFLSHFAQVVETGKPIQVEDYFEPLRMHMQISAFHLGGQRFATLATDITERKRAEEALRESQARLDLALRSSEMGVWSLDLIENQRFFDDQVCHLLGLDPAKFTGKAEEFFNAVHPEDREAVKSALARSIEHGVPYESEYRTIWPDGSSHHIAARGKLVYDTEGRPVRINGLVWEVTERKHAEEALRLSEEKFAFAFAGNPAAIALTRFEDGLIREVNDTYLTMFGYSRDEVIGRSTLDLNIWPPTDDRARQGKELREKGSFRGREQTLLRRSGESFVALGSAALLKFAGEELVVSTWLDISERKHAEEAMRESEERFRKIFENAVTGIVITDWEGRFQQANQAYCAMLGYTEEELCGLGYFAQLVHPEDRESNLKKIGPLKAREIPFFEVENRYVRKDGLPVWVHKFFSILTDATGRPSHLVGLVTDITERKRAEEALRQARDELEQRVQERTLDLHLANEVLLKTINEREIAQGRLRESEARFAAFMEYLPGLAVMRDMEGSCLFANRAWEETMRLEPGAWQRRTLTQLFPPEQAAGHQKLDFEIIASGKPTERVELVELPDGPHHFLSKHFPILDEEGLPYMVGNIAIDITQRRRAEEALVEHAAMVHDLYNHAPCGYHSLDPEGVFVQINDTELAWLGYTRKEVVGRLNFSDILTPESLQYFRENFPSFKKRGWVKDLEFDLIRKDGSVFPVLLNSTAIKDDSGNYLMSRSTLFDNTERLRAEQELRESEARLRYLAAQLLEIQEQERKRLSMDLHDDLGQSLLVLRMQLNAILRGHSPEPPVRQGIEEAAAYLREVIDKVRSLSHSLSPTPLESIGLTMALRSLLDEFQKYHESNIETDLDEVGRLLPKESHIGIYRILQEFLANVHKHAEARKVKVAIKARPGQVAISLEDDGKGFSLEELQDGPQKQRGLGLLSMEERVRMMGGRLSLTSRKGQGTRLYFELPRARE